MAGRRASPGQPHTTREGNPVIACAKYVATTHVVFVVCRVPAREHMRSGSRRAGQEFGRPGATRLVQYGYPVRFVHTVLQKGCQSSERKQGAYSHPH